jgi:exosome complex component RRP4
MEKTKEKLYVSDREIVVPGDILAEGMSYLPSGRATRESNKIIAISLGLTNIKGHVVKVIPLAGRYIPKRGDAVIGKITGITRGGWRVDIRCPFEADLPIGEASYNYIDTNKYPMSKFFDIGDFIFANITDINEKRFIKLSTKNRPYRKLHNGIIIEVSPTKIPRIIGKQGSMIKMLKENSGCDILVGQNGWVWINNENPEKQMLMADAIKKIETDSHTTGLTDKIKKMLNKKGGSK